MASGLSWVRVVPLVALLWGLPAEVRAELFEQAFVDGKVERLKTVQPQPLLRPMQLPLVKQAGTVKQNDATQDVLLEVEGALAEGDAQLDDGSLYDVHLFDGQAGQIVRITLVSDEFDTFLLLKDASGEELTRNNDGSESSNAEIVFRLQSVGQYQIFANAYNESDRGAYRLTVATADEATLHQAELKAEADRLLQQGSDSLRISQYREALESAQVALEIYLELGNRQGEANSLSTMGIAYRRLGEYQRAIDFQQQSLAIVRDIGDHQGEAASLGNLGNTYYSLGEYQRAIDFHQQSLAITKEIGDRQSEVASLVNLGLNYYRLGEYQRAIDFHQQSLAIAKEIDDRQGEVASLGNLGNTYYSLGEFQRAIDFQQQSLAIAREISDRQSEAASLGNLGNTYYSLEEYQNAIDFQQQYLVIAREIGDRQGEINSLRSLGLAYEGLGEYQRAKDFYQQSLAIAREIGDRQGEANALGSLGIAYDILGEYQRATDFQQQSLAITREIGDRQGEAISLGNLGLSYFKQEQAVLAEESLLGSISIFESLRSSELSDRDRITFFETQAQTYKSLQLVLTSQNKISEALEVSDRGRARSFVQLVSEKLSAGSEAQVEANPLSFSEMQKVAEEQESVLVEYSIVSTTEGNPLLYIWVMQPTGDLDFRQVPLGNDPDRLSELVNQSRKAIGVRGRGLALSRAEDVQASDKLRELHQLMIEPIADLLPSDPEQRVVFVPQGELFLVPFPALIDESGTYLIKQHTLLTAPSIQVLSLTQRQANAHARSPKSDTNLLAVGNPVMPEVWNPETAVTAQLPSLLGSEQEAQAIASLFDTEALLGANATEAAVKQKIGNARIIHLATHGLLEYGTPEDSGVRDVPGAIALAPSQNEDGLLTSAEILELTLQADLVVLSACDTGLGTITGDGIIGLSRSLTAAGASSVIVSLWSIPDAPTAELMVEFYRQMQQGKDKAQALRQAMLATKENHPNPGDWAAFTLIGSAE